MNIKQKLTFENAIVAIFTSLFLTAGLFTFFAKPTFIDKNIFGAINTFIYLGMFVFLAAVIFFSNLVFDFKIARKFIMLGTFMFYAAVVVVDEKNPFFAIGVCVVLLAILCFIFKDDMKFPFKIPKQVVISAAVIFAVYFVVFFSIQSVSKYLALRTPIYDFGLFAQMYYNMGNTFLPDTTCERDMLLSHFAVHVSPIYYVLLPIYFIFPHPMTILICQTIVLALGVIPLSLLCKKLKLSNLATIIFIAIYALYPALSGGIYYDFHENKFLPVLLLFLFYFMEKENLLGSCIFALLVCMVKEDAPIYVAFFAFYYFIAFKDKKKRILAGGLFITAVLYFISVTTMLSMFGQGVMSYRYNNFLQSGETSLFMVIINIIKNPALVINEIFTTTNGDTSKLFFMIQMLLPLGFMPVITKRYERLLLLLPFILVNLMPDYQYQHDIYFQYTYGSFPFLLYASILNFKDLKGNTRKTLGTLSVCAAFLVCMQTVYARATYLDFYLEDKAVLDDIRITLEQIPEDASVTAATFYGAAASQRPEMYSLNHTKEHLDSDYIAVDMRYPEGKDQRAKYEANSNYEIVKEIEGYFVLFKSKSYTPAT